MQSVRRNLRGPGGDGTGGQDERRQSLAFGRGADIGLQQDKRDASGQCDPVRVLKHGWAFRAIYLPDGRRYVRSFVLPGDIIGAEYETWPRSIGQVIAATDVECLQVDRAMTGLSSAEAAQLRARMAGAVQEEVALMAGVALRLGKLSPYERIMHFFLETLERSRRAELTADNRFWCPVPQEVLADSLGLSKVHLNRNLQALRSDRIIRYESSMVELLDVPAIAERVSYESLYGTTDYI